MSPTAPTPPLYSPGYLPTQSTGRALAGLVARLLGVSLLIALLVNPNWHAGWQDFALNFVFTATYTVGLWLTNGLSVDWLNPRVSWTEQPARRLALTLLFSLVGSLLVITLVNMLFWQFYFHRPLRELFGQRLLGQIGLPLFITVFVSLTLHARSFFLSWREATVRAERLEKETAVARLDSLRRQVDPHFLFNSLNALTSLVEEADPARAVRFIRQLSGVYRYVLDSQSQELVPLSEELAFAEAYVYLQKTRLGDALDFQLTTSPAHQLINLHLPPLALQLLLENALKHNTAFQADPLRLRVAVDEAAGTLTVRNTLRPRHLSADETSGRGLANLRARYGFLTSQPVQAGPVAGEFVVVLPLLALN